jgi:hypothetical protein
MQYKAMHVKESRTTMSTEMKKPSKDDTRLGEHAAKQPLSGTNLVMMVRVKSSNSANYFNIAEAKKAV